MGFDRDAALATRPTGDAFQQALYQSMDPQHNTSHPEWRYLAILTGWLLGGIIVAVLTFRWQKRGT